LEKFCKKKRLPLYPISAVTGAGVEKLKFAMGKMVQDARKADAA
jgi:GTPase